MTQKNVSLPPVGSEHTSGRSSEGSLVSLDLYPASPGFLDAALEADLDPPPDPPGLPPPARKPRSQERTKTPECRRGLRELRLTPKANKTMQNASLSRARQNQEGEMQAGDDIDDSVPQTDGVDEGREISTSLMVIAATSSPATSSPPLNSSYDMMEDATPKPSNIRYPSLPYHSVAPNAATISTQTWGEVHSTHSHPQHDYSLTENMDSDMSVWMQNTMNATASSSEQYHTPNGSWVPPRSHQYQLPPVHPPQMTSQNFNGQFSGNTLPYLQAPSLRNLPPDVNLLSRPTSSHSITSSHSFTPSQNFQGPSSLHGHHLPISTLGRGMAGGVSMPGETKWKGKKRAQEPEGLTYQEPTDIPIPSHPPSVPSHPIQSQPPTVPSYLSVEAHTNETSSTTSGSPTSSTGGSSPSSGSLSKSAITALELFYEQVEKFLIEAAYGAGLSPERVTKLLGKRLGIKSRGSATTWNEYQNFFAAHMQQELRRINAEEEYACATSAQKPGIVSRAQDAFKASFRGESDWVEVLKVWEELNTVSNGCKEQTYSTRESAFSSTNREINNILRRKSLQYDFSYAFIACGSRVKNDSGLSFFTSTPLCDGFLPSTARADNMDDFMARMQAYVHYRAEQAKTSQAWKDEETDRGDSSGSSRSELPKVFAIKDGKGSSSDADFIRNAWREGFASAGGTSSRNMPFLTMSTALSNSGIMVKEYPFNLPFPFEIENSSKGIESLSVQQQALLKEAFLHSKTPITFQKLTDNDIQLVKISKAPVITTTICTSLPRRRRLLFLNNATIDQFISNTGNTASSLNATALANDASASESESEASMAVDPQTPVQKKTTRSKRNPVVKAEPGVKAEKPKAGKGALSKRSHSVTVISSGSKSDNLPSNGSPKRTRFADGSDSSFEISEITPAPKSRKTATAPTQSAPKTRASAKVKTVSRKKSVQYKSKVFVSDAEDDMGSDEDDAPAPSSSNPIYLPKPRPATRDSTVATKNGTLSSALDSQPSSPLTPLPISSPIKPSNDSRAANQAMLKKLSAPHPPTNLRGGDLAAPRPFTALNFSTTAAPALPLPSPSSPFARMGSAFLPAESRPAAGPALSNTSSAPAPPNQAMLKKFSAPHPPTKRGGELAASRPSTAPKFTTTAAPALPPPSPSSPFATMGSAFLPAESRPAAGPVLSNTSSAPAPPLPPPFTSSSRPAPSAPPLPVPGGLRRQEPRQGPASRPKMEDKPRRAADSLQGQQIEADVRMADADEQDEGQCLASGGDGRPRSHADPRGDRYPRSDSLQGQRIEADVPMADADEQDERQSLASGGDGRPRSHADPRGDRYSRSRTELRGVGPSRSRVDPRRDGGDRHSRSRTESRGDGPSRPREERDGDDRDDRSRSPHGDGPSRSRTERDGYARPRDYRPASRYPSHDGSGWGYESLHDRPYNNQHYYAERSRRDYSPHLPPPDSYRREDRASSPGGYHRRPVRDLSPGYGRRPYYEDDSRGHHQDSYRQSPMHSDYEDASIGSPVRV